MTRYEKFVLYKNDRVNKHEKNMKSGKLQYCLDLSDACNDNKSIT